MIKGRAYTFDMLKKAAGNTSYINSLRHDLDFLETGRRGVFFAKKQAAYKCRAANGETEIKNGGYRI